MGGKVVTAVDDEIPDEALILWSPTCPPSSSSWGGISWGLGDRDLSIAWTNVPDRCKIGEPDCLILMRAWADGEMDRLSRCATRLVVGEDEP